MDGQLEADAETENDGEKEAGVVLDGDDGVELAAKTEDEDAQRAGENEEVTEAGTGEKEADGGGHEGNDEAFLFLIETGGDEQPDLIEDEGRGENGSADEAHLQIQVHRVHRVEEVQFVDGQVEFFERCGNDSVELLAEAEGDEEADGEIDCRVDDALAELFEVLHQAHAGKLGALGDGLASLVDGFGWINHGWHVERPAPIFPPRE